MKMSRFYGGLLREEKAFLRFYSAENFRFLLKSNGAHSPILSFGVCDFIDKRQKMAFVNGLRLLVKKTKAKL